MCSEWSRLLHFHILNFKRNSCTCRIGLYVCSEWSRLLHFHILNFKRNSCTCRIGLYVCSEWSRLLHFHILNFKRNSCTCRITSCVVVSVTVSKSNHTQVFWLTKINYNLMMEKINESKIFEQRKRIFFPAV